MQKLFDLAYLLRGGLPSPISCLDLELLDGFKVARVFVPKGISVPGILGYQLTIELGHQGNGLINALREAKGNRCKFGLSLIDLLHRLGQPRLAHPANTPNMKDRWIGLRFFNRMAQSSQKIFGLWARNVGLEHGTG